MGRSTPLMPSCKRSPHRDEAARDLGAVAYLCHSQGGRGRRPRYGMASVEALVACLAGSAGPLKPSA